MLIPESRNMCLKIYMYFLALIMKTVVQFYQAICPKHSGWWFSISHQILHPDTTQLESDEQCLNISFQRIHFIAFPVILYLTIVRQKDCINTKNSTRQTSIPLYFHLRCEWLSSWATLISFDCSAYEHSFFFFSKTFLLYLLPLNSFIFLKNYNNSAIQRITLQPVLPLSSQWN